MDEPSSSSPARRPLGFAWGMRFFFVLLAAFFLAMLGLRPLGNPDEGRYTEIPREMLATGDFVTPRLDGVKYFEKPPLAYWLTAASLKVFGVNEFGARFWTGVFGWLGVLLTYLAARALFDEKTGLLSALVLATSLLYYGLSQVLLLDLFVTVFMAGALFSFLFAVQTPAGPRRRGLFWGFYAGMALGVMTKGLMAFALPGAVAFWWVLVFNRWRRLAPFYPISGTLIFATIAVPWHVFVARANPDFLYFYFVHEHFLRYTTQIHDRYEPWWYFIPVFLGGLFPWVVFLFPALARALKRTRADAAESSREQPDEAKQRETVWFLIIWVGFIILFFSASGSKLPPYILPVFPAAAVLLGRYLVSWWEDKPGAGSWGWFYLSAGFACAAAIAVPLIRVARDATIRAELRPWQWALASAFALSAVAVGWFGQQRRGRSAIVAIALTVVAITATLPPIFSKVDRRSTKPLALALKARLAPGDAVYSYKDYNQDLPVYLGRTVEVVDYQGELAFGIRAEPDQTGWRFIGTEEFVHRWNGAERCFAVAHKADAASLFARPDFPHVIVSEFREHVLFSNR